MAQLDDLLKKVENMKEYPVITKDALKEIRSLFKKKGDQTEWVVVDVPQEIELLSGGRFVASPGMKVVVSATTVAIRSI